MSSHIRRSVAAAGALAALMTLTPKADAQVAWDAPQLMSPGAPAGWGLHLFDSDHSDLGVFATYRTGDAPVGLGFRFGLADDAPRDLALFGGVDVSGSVYRGAGEAPLDVIWFAGVGIGFEDDALLSFPAGLSLGWLFAGDRVAFQPYVAPKVVLDAYLGDEERPRRFGDDDDLDLSAALEIGMDLHFEPSFTLRTAASLADRDAVSIGIQLPVGR